jgi:8-oxo-dGTP pyrophosphatase MutT (NUDIX family)
VDIFIFSEKLKERLKEPLPGEEAQFKMAPLRRKELLEMYRAGNYTPVQSAVLISLYPKDNSIYTALMLRTKDAGAHSEQVSFPGGKQEAFDESLFQTAWREAQEEVGIGDNKIMLKFALTPVYIPVSNFMVNPFVVVFPEILSFHINEKEVKELLEMDVGFLFDPKNKGTAFFQSKTSKIEAPFYRLKEHKIWGATAMLLSELETILREIEI